MLHPSLSAAMLTLALLTCPALGDDEPKAAADVPKDQAGAPGFMKDVAPILVRNCIACHNGRKSEGKYDMTTFDGLAHGGQTGDNLEPGDPEASHLVELIRPDGQPRMPYKLDPLPAPEVAAIESWIKAGARYDGLDPKEDWVTLLHKTTPVNVPESYPVAVPITALAYSPDGTEVASAGYHEVNLWKVADGALTRRLRGVPERTYDLAYSPDGKWLATAGGDPGQFGSARLWIAEPDGGGKPVRDLFESPDCLFAVAFSPDSKLVAAAGADRAIRVWEVDSGKLIVTIEDHADWVLDLAFSPDGKRLASASRDKTAKVFDVEKKEALVTFPGHAETVYCVAFDKDGKSVATGGGDNQVRVWRPDEDAKQVKQLGGFGGAVFQVRFGPDGKRLLACSADKSVRVFEDLSPKHTLSGHGDWVYSLAVSPDGKSAASGSWDGDVRLWNLDDGKPVRAFLAAPGLIKPGADAQASAK